MIDFTNLDKPDAYTVAPASGSAIHTKLCYKFKLDSQFSTHRNLKRSPSTPIAVTAAPAPAPCTINGRAPYRSVWNMTMLSDPPSEVTKGCVLGYLSATWTRRDQHGCWDQFGTHLSRSALITPEATSMTPTNLNTLFSLNASDLIWSNSWS